MMRDGYQSLFHQLSRTRSDATDVRPLQIGDHTMTTDLTQTSAYTLDALFEILANQQRRYTLYHLSKMKGVTITLSELIDVLVQDVTATRTQLRLELHHCHLPKLADYNIIEYDPRSQTIRYHNSDRLETLLGVCQHHERE
jgi:hypothetical protein